MHGSGQLGGWHLEASKYFIMCKLSSASLAGVMLQNWTPNSNRNALRNSKMIRAIHKGSRDKPRAKFQNPGNRTPKRSALSVFYKRLAQNGACELFALEHFCAAAPRSGCSPRQSVCSPAHSRFLPTRLPFCAPSPQAAAIAAARSPKCAAAASRCASPKNTRIAGGPPVAPNLT